MIVYVDILFLVNFLIDYFMLLLTANVLHIKYKTYRMLCASLIGAISSLYIFIPNSNLLLEVIVKFATAFFMNIAAFKFSSIKNFLKASGALLLITLLFGAIINFFVKTFNPKNIIVYNSVVYCNISAVTLVIFTVIFYMFFSLIAKIFKKSSKTAQKSSVTAFYKENHIQFTAIVDSGNSLEDAFSKSDIIIVDESILKKLLKTSDFKESNLSTLFRIIPCSTVSGEGALQGYRCDKAVIKTEDVEIEVEKPVLAISKTRLNEGYEGIVNPKILEYIGV